MTAFNDAMIQKTSYLCLTFLVSLALTAAGQNGKFRKSISISYGAPYGPIRTGCGLLGDNKTSTVDVDLVMFATNSGRLRLALGAGGQAIIDNPLNSDLYAAQAKILPRYLFSLSEITPFIGGQFGTRLISNGGLFQDATIGFIQCAEMGMQYRISEELIHEFSLGFTVNNVPSVRDLTLPMEGDRGRCANGGWIFDTLQFRMALVF